MAAVTVVEVVAEAAAVGVVEVEAVAAAKHKNPALSPLS